MCSWDRIFANPLSSSRLVIFAFSAPFYWEPATSEHAPCMVKAENLSLGTLYYLSHASWTTGWVIPLPPSPVLNPVIVPLSIFGPVYVTLVPVKPKKSIRAEEYKQYRQELLPPYSPIGSWFTNCPASGIVSEEVVAQSRFTVAVLVLQAKGLVSGIRVTLVSSLSRPRCLLGLGPAYG